MSCPNKKAGYSRWICLCTSGSTRETLASLWNGWLSPDQIRYAHAVAKDEAKTEEELKRLLASLEADASHAHGFWEMGN